MTTYRTGRRNIVANTNTPATPTLKPKKSMPPGAQGAANTVDKVGRPMGLQPPPPPPKDKPADPGSPTPYDILAEAMHRSGIGPHPTDKKVGQHVAQAVAEAAAKHAAEKLKTPEEKADDKARAQQQAAMTSQPTQGTAFGKPRVQAPPAKKEKIKTGSNKVTANYSPDQPRDGHGRFAESPDTGGNTSGGGGAKPRVLSTKPPKTFGVKQATYDIGGGTRLQVVHSKYSAAMRTGSALSGYSYVQMDKPHPYWKGERVWDSNAAKEFRGDNHEEKAARYVKKHFGVEHDHKALKEFKG